MVMNDTLANALTMIDQYERLGKAECMVTPGSSIIASVLNILKQFGYVKGFAMVKDGNKETAAIQLQGKVNRCGVIKPRFAVKYDEYEKFEKRYLPAQDMGIIVVSTVQGMMDHSTAKQKKLGGRLIAYCY